MHRKRVLQVFAALAATLALGAPDSAAAGSDADRSFTKFCQQWMGKLAKRESNNVNKARAKRDGSRWVVEYVSYAKRPLSCEAKATGVRSNPFIGKMVYTERQVRKHGATQDEARNGGEVQVISQTEVMEIFRFDGHRWVY